MKMYVNLRCDSNRVPPTHLREKLAGLSGVTFGVKWAVRLAGAAATGQLLANLYRTNHASRTSVSTRYRQASIIRSPLGSGTGSPNSRAVSIQSAIA